MAFLLKLDWIFLVLLSVLTRLLPFLIYGQNPLGYDTGFYRHYIIQSFTSIPNHATAGLTANATVPRIILDTLRALGLPTDLILYGTLIIAFTGSVLALRFIIKKFYGKEAGFISGLLFIFSGVQQTGYWFFLLKNYIALTFLFLFLYQLKRFLDQPNLLEKFKPFSFSIKELFLLFFPAALVFLSHKTTSVILIVSLFFALAIFLLQKFWHKLNPFTAITSSIIIIAALIKITLWQNLHPQPPAIFLEWPQFLSLTAPILLILLLNLKNLKYKIAENPLFPLFLTGNLFTLLEWTFYQRIFLFLDLTLIAFAAEGFSLIKNNYTQNSYNKKITTIVVLALFTGYYLGNFYLTVKKYSPIITKEEITEIKNLDNIAEKNSTILTVSDYTPWIHGFSHRQVMSPGLLEYNYNLADWQKFWFEMNQTEKINFLKVFPKPLYFFTIPYSNDNFIDATCVKEKTKYLRSFECSD